MRLVRRVAADKDEVGWDELDARGSEALSGVEAVIHLAGESIMGRWTAGKKKLIRETRTEPTRKLSQVLASMAIRPLVMISASAVGYYGSRNDESLTEDSPAGNDFLAEVSRAWEEATEPARRVGIRVLNLRFGLVLSAEGGALKQMLLPFRMGVGGRTGSGNQWMSWVSLEDVTRAISFALENERLAGAVNVTAPHPVTNAEFTKALARQLHRPAVIPMPALAVRTLFGEMGESLLLGSQRVIPAKLLETGFVFQHRELDGALRAILAKCH